MNRYLSTLVLLLSALTAVSSTSRPFSRGVGAPLFGIRGGGLFGGKDDSKDDASATSTVVGDKKLYPAMSQEEVEDWLEHIPVFAVTDSAGSGVVLKPDNDTSVFYFFLNPLSANATLSQLKSMNEDMDLKVSAFSLGKIWFKLLNSDPNQEVLVSSTQLCCRILRIRIH
jgi:Tic22-like family